jgi:hypothetical protein
MLSLKSIRFRFSVRADNVQAPKQKNWERALADIRSRRQIFPDSLFRMLHENRLKPH